ncbi:hypothetical protein [Bdellovibrio svalbardensis]|uniref:Ig-like domain-containing protein n=1 Tax=Bdellovibrio svalbardensis TaxID=2972972 RepID=A0ABT6DLF5_9BACT|nr:hypothetical protein [Bdellovibrio svalbardensis]MDG0817491.1 hypothetical protein [Bdellovibrio svalbardensis]
MNHIARLAILPILFVSVKALAISSLTRSSTFVDAQKLWQDSQEVSSTEINGNWKRIAVYEHEDCKDIMHGPAYDVSGIRNQDGSVFTLAFEGHQVKFLNVGIATNTQGPYEIHSRFSNFSSWAYDENTKAKEMTDQAYGSYSCRVVSDANKQLICAVGTGLKQEAISDSTFKACSKLKTGLIVLFSKVD